MGALKLKPTAYECLANFYELPINFEDLLSSILNDKLQSEHDYMNLSSGILKFLGKDVLTTALPTSDATLRITTSGIYECDYYGFPVNILYEGGIFESTVGFKTK